ncbi:MAG: DUF2226 domain-containing protein [archaeon]
MNLPASNPVEQGLSLNETDVKKMVADLTTHNFTGFISATVEGFDGLEESLLLFKQGFLVAVSFNYLKQDLKFLGQDAFKRVFNSLASNQGIIDVFSLTLQQLDLVMAFNEKSKLSKSVSRKDLNSFYTSNYQVEPVKVDLKQSGLRVQSKYDLLKKRGLSGITS